ncbi:MAG: hypothetical protein AAF591_06165 [Verrucomicrobiota bacterium]
MNPLQQSALYLRQTILIACVLILVQPRGHGAPVIVEQSHSYDVVQGYDFAAYVEAVGVGLTYQWYKSGTLMPSETGSELHITPVADGDAGSYRVRITDGSGNEVYSDAVVLGIIPKEGNPVAPGARGNVRIPNSLAVYDVYLPTGYSSSGTPYPVLITYSPGGGGMVNVFETVAEERQWVIIGERNSRNGQFNEDKALATKVVIDHVVTHLNVDPNRIFTSGSSGGAWRSFTVAKNLSPVVAGVFSMAGWLGNQHSNFVDRYLPGLLVARSFGNTDTGAQNYRSIDRFHLEKYTATENIIDFDFIGGHQPAPEPEQRLAFDWFVSKTSASSAVERAVGNEKEAKWKARVTAGDTAAVYVEVVNELFSKPRTPDGLAAWRALDFLFSRFELFGLRETPTFEEFSHTSDLMQLYYYLQLNFRHDPDRSMICSLGLAIDAIDLKTSFFQNTSYDPDIWDCPARPLFDGYILAEGLWNRSELPYLGDWDGDGVSNFIEFILGRDPLLEEGGYSRESLMNSANSGSLAYYKRARSGPLQLLTPKWSTGVSSWNEISDGNDINVRVRPDGTVDVFAPLPEDDRNEFVIFEAELDTENWNDRNGDGIPTRYYQDSYFSADEDPASADRRFQTVIPGGIPEYLKYLTVTEVKEVQDMGGYYHYHPELLGHHGVLYHEVWTNSGGTLISGGVNNAINRRPPEFVALTKESEAPWHAENRSLVWNRYIERTRGYFIPAESGSFVFMISGDNECEFRLSTNDNPSNASVIASVSAAGVSYRDFSVEANQVSAGQSLVAGEEYYFEILHKEGGGEDHCTVFVDAPSAPPGTMTGAQIRCLSLGDLD